MKTLKDLSFIIAAAKITPILVLIGIALFNFFTKIY